MESTATKLNKFLGDDTGAVTIDWVALTAGILLLGIMVVYAIFNGGVAGLVADINATLAAVITDVDTGDAPDLNGIDVASSGDSMTFFSGAVSIPLGSAVAVESDFENGVVITFSDPNGGPLLKFRPSSDVSILDGATVGSSSTFKLSKEFGGETVQASDFGLAF